MKTIYENSYVCMESECNPGTMVWAKDGVRRPTVIIPGKGEMKAADYPEGTVVSVKIEVKE